MSYAIELSARQSTRTLEQAIRHQAEVLLQSRTQNDDELFCGRVVAIETPVGWRSRRPCLVMTLDNTCEAATTAGARDSTVREMTADMCQKLLGTYCDVAIQLGQHRYLFCGDIVAVHEGSPQQEATRIYIARPETLQVAQRRRFRRFRPAQSARVELQWTSPDGSTGEGIGWLCNVSADGLACRVDVRVSDQLGIGEQVRVEFALTPGDPERFVLDAVLCNKTPAGTQGTMIVGVQFLTDEGHEPSARTADDLRRQLLARYTPVVDSSGGIDS